MKINSSNYFIVTGNIAVTFRDFSSSVIAEIFPLWAVTVAAATDKPIPYPPVSEFLDLSVR